MSGLRILAVDDDEIVLRLLSEVLTQEGYSDVRTFASPKKALATVRSDPEHFDCILLDIQMPELDGIELCRAIRNLPGYETTPILMLTVMSEKSYIDRAFSAGATDYVTKPFDPTEVAVRLGVARQLVDERKMLSDNAQIIDSFIEVLDETTQHDLIEPIDLGKMDGLLSYPAFENYLYQSGRSVLFLATVFAVKIANVENWHEKLPPLEFKALLRQSARAVIQRLDEHDVFLAYRGDGEFVGVVPRNGSKSLRNIGEQIDLEASESEGKFGAYLPSTVKLVIGEPVANRIPTRGGILKNIWTALEKVRARGEIDRSQSTGAPEAGASPNPYAGERDAKEAKKSALKAEFEGILQDKLRYEVGEPRAKPERMDRNANSVFKFAKRTGVIEKAKGKNVFGRAAGSKPQRDTQKIEPSAGGSETDQSELKKAET